MRSHRRQSLLLFVAMGVVALVAQVAGVGGARDSARQPRAAKATSLAVIQGGSVPDVGSTKLQSVRLRAKADVVVRMSAVANVRLTRVRKGTTAQVVCGIRYSRDADASWSLGVPYETVQLTARTSRQQVRIERSFSAPAADTYRMSVACHVATPRAGATVTGTGTMRASLGLPAGAATPVE